MDAERAGDAHSWETATRYDVGGPFDDEISRALTRLISELGPGSMLPNERDLAATLGVSRNALRDRIRLLEAAGILSRRQGAGTFVQKTASTEGLAVSLDLLVATGQLSLDGLHEVRIALESRALVVACEAPEVRSDVLDAMQACIDGMSADFGSPRVADHDLEFHRLIFVASDNPALTLFAGALHTLFKRAIFLGTHNWQAMGVGRHLLVALHQDILDALRARDARAATASLEAHFSVHSRVARAMSIS